MDPKARAFLLAAPSLAGLNAAALANTMQANGIVSLWDIAQLTTADLTELAVPPNAVSGVQRAVEAAAAAVHAQAQADAKAKPKVEVIGGVGGGKGGAAPAANQWVRCVPCNGAMTAHRGRVPASYPSASAAGGGGAGSGVDCDGCGQTDLNVGDEWYHCDACGKVDYCAACVRVKLMFSGAPAAAGGGGGGGGKIDMKHEPSPTPIAKSVQCGRGHAATNYAGRRPAYYAAGTITNCDVCNAEGIDTALAYYHCDVCRDWDCCAPCARAQLAR